ncbi:bifunctional 4-hydroxy-2-oxoglutarate aldolase/2-dehydro-3-deoxy-phosphogluconate aldolase [Marinibactrum halimedae]|uniref:2-dehydro-3-deoxy-phosphogluconate aldolase n=1 Tax=Marinibactrum halimedae TaxID=1444977 RepID=A0AA37T9U1_9GAMM|nr:bifunctional 4-hydroxy-2-oxoglutarate aldolase/2-dehydro-3-deoxy-phosphogluconate aldolase [Marinibactrum halimedae]MCD9460947.1 bifunctional 4-hydroxy-2-oxoglutarate aldolase/2-dehydro-3-deoxy-phosphogluconate aldolase [Marinibactrum halimedae]GLS27418.1 ketohydroxyglutarate aldolase [Marinibactrum halimedae]
MDNLRQTLKDLKIVPVLTPVSVEKTVEMTRAMAAGGINSVEITLRTDCAFDAIKAVQEADLGVQVGVGTIINAELVHKVADMGVDFAVTPGITPAVLSAAKERELNVLPGVSGPSELMLGLEYGYTNFKLFPAAVVNGLAMLKALAGPFPDICFCPTGGVSESNANEFLSLPNVVCVGGSWMLPKAAIESGDWNTITEISRRAMSL